MVVFCLCAVSTNTKIQIWKQITTTFVKPRTFAWLYQPIQKYKFESKSQHSCDETAFRPRCINQYKNTNLKANHNWLWIAKHGSKAVSTNTKIQIWKQITTPFTQFQTITRLYQPIQKYKFESKSQRPCLWQHLCYCCINQYKNTNLKANHNLPDELSDLCQAVSTNTKIQIWKQITTAC